MAETIQTKNAMRLSRRNVLARMLAVPAALGVAIPLMTDSAEAQDPDPNAPKGAPKAGPKGKGKAKGKGPGAGNGQGPGVGKGKGKGRGKGKGKGKGKGPVAADEGNAEE